jgi:magnesium chelatase family protein
MAQYQGRISGPLMDRIDLVIEVPAVSAADMVRPAPAEGSAPVAIRVARARARAAARHAALGFAGARTNARLPTQAIDSVVSLDPGAQKLLQDAAEKMRLTARGYHRVLKVARTLADLDDVDSVRRVHLAEALSYRMAQERMHV